MPRALQSGFLFLPPMYGITQALITITVAVPVTVEITITSSVRHEVWTREVFCSQRSLLLFSRGLGPLLSRMPPPFLKDVSCSQGSRLFSRAPLVVIDVSLLSRRCCPMHEIRKVGACTSGEASSLGPQKGAS